MTWDYADNIDSLSSILTTEICDRICIAFSSTIVQPNRMIDEYTRQLFFSTAFILAHNLNKLSHGRMSKQTREANYDIVYCSI